MRTMKRILALVLAVFLLVMVFVTLYLAVTGSRYFMVSLYVTLGFPLLLYAYLFIYRLLKEKGRRDDQK